MATPPNEPKFKMASKKSPEYKTLREHFHDICDALSQVPNSISPLANDLCAASIISTTTRTAVTAIRGVAPYDLASQLISAVHVTVEYNSNKFYDLVEKLNVHGFNILAQMLYEKCETLGGRAAPSIAEEDVGETPPTSNTTIDFTHPSLQTEPSFLDLSNLVAARIPNKWRDLGLQLGLRVSELDGIYDRRNRVPAHCFMDVFESWEKGTMSYTWSTLLKGLSSPFVNEKGLAIEISQEIIRRNN